MNPQPITDDLRIQFHERVADPKQPVMFIGQDNDNTGIRHLSARKAVETRRSYCVPVRSGLVAADFDDKTPNGRPQNGAQQADKFAADLKHLGLRPVVVNSGGEARAHVWCQVRKDLIEQVRQKIKDYDGDDRTASKIRPPFAPHRMGTSMSLRGNLTVEEALNALTIEDDAPQNIEDPQLLEMLHSIGDGDRSVHVMRVVGYMKRHGYTDDQTVKAILDHPQGAGNKYFYRKNGRRLGRPDPKRSQKIRDAYRKASETAESPDRKQIEPMLNRMESYAMSYTWPKRNEALLPTYKVLLDVGFKQGRLNVGISCRELAERVGVGRATAARHLNKLSHLGFIQQDQSATITAATTYHLVPKGDLETLRGETLNSTPQGHTGCARVSHFVVIAVDAFFGRGSSRNWFTHLTQMPDLFTISDLADAGHRSYESARKALSWFEFHGLVKRDGRRWTPTITEETIQGAAQARQTAGRIERMKIEHTHQRNGWREYMADLFRKLGGKLPAMTARRKPSESESPPSTETKWFTQPRPKPTYGFAVCMA